MTSSAFDLLQLAVQAFPRYLRLALRSLSPSEREALDQQLCLPIATLLRACRFSENALISKDDAGFGAPFARVSEIWPLLASQWPQLEAPLQGFDQQNICLYAAEDAGLFYLKLQMLKVALRPKIYLVEAFEHSDSLPFIWSHNVEESWLYNLGSCLIQRPESWRFEVLEAALQRLESMPSPLGYARLLLVLHHRQEAPELLERHWGPAMYLDGFREEELRDYPPAAIFAGLSYEPPEWPNLSHYQMPLSSAETALYQRLHAEDIPRSAWRELILKRLLRAPKPSRARLWVRAWEAEQQHGGDLGEAYLEYWQALLYAPTAPAVRLATGQLKLLLNDCEIDAPALLEGVLHALNHPIQVAAQGAWSLFKLIYRKWPELQGHCLERLAPHLALSHENLRQDLLRWLSKQSPLPARIQTEIQGLQSAQLLTPLELELLGVNPFPQRRDLELESENIQWTHIPSMYHAALQQWLKPSAVFAPEAVEAAPLSHSKDLDPRAERLWFEAESAASLAQFFLEIWEEGPTPLSMEALMRNVLRFPRPAQEHLELQQQLAPLLKVKEAWEQGFTSARFYPQQAHSYALIALASGWLQHSAAPLDISAVSYIYYQAQIAAPLSYALLEQVHLTLQALVHDHIRLAQPESAQGWIRNRSFAERLSQWAPQRTLQQQTGHSALGDQDLGLALLRLLHDEDIWADIESFCTPYQEDWQWACAIACAPLAQARQLLKRWVNSLNQAPPNDWLFQVRFQSLQPRDTRNNRRFQLLSRAVFSRCGGADARVVFPDLLRLKLDDLQINLGVDYSQQHQLSESLSRGLESLLNGESFKLWEWVTGEELQQRHETLAFKQHPAQRKLEQACWHPAAQLENPFLHQSQLERNLDPQPLPYPQLLPHILSWLGEQHQPGYGSPFDLYEDIHPLYFYFPPLRSLLWKQAIKLLRDTQFIPRHAFVMGLLRLGFSPDIPLQAQDLGPLMHVLQSKYPEHRQCVLALFQQGLLDGRLTAQALIEHWSITLAESTQSALLQSLETWMDLGCAQEVVGLLILEQWWAREDELPPRILNRSLSLYLRHLRYYSSWSLSEPELWPRFREWSKQRNRKLSERAALILKFLEQHNSTPYTGHLLRAALVQSVQAQPASVP